MHCTAFEKLKSQQLCSCSINVKKISLQLQILMSKTSQLKMACKEGSGCIAQLKQQKSKKVILLGSTPP